MFLIQTDRLPPELLASVTSRDLARGEYLFHQGEAALAVFTVMSGRMLLSTTTSDGKQVPLYTVRAGECVSEAALFADAYCSDAMAETKWRLGVFPNAALQKTLLLHPSLAVEFMTLQAKRCNAMRLNLELRSLRSARERVLQFIKMFASPKSKALSLDRPLKNIADDLGLTHESFYRTFNELIRDGVVVRKGKIIELSSL